LQCVDDNTLVAYAGHALAGEPRLVVEEHLGSCAVCRELLFALATASGTAPRDGVASPSKLGRYIVEQPIGSGPPMPFVSRRRRAPLRRRNARRSRARCLGPSQ
jgi:predicted anti-sigma-YlaC factor YlaD